MLRLDNAQARRLFLHKHALAEPPTGPAKGTDLADLITRLGFVQLDSVRTVERAHHMILFSRRQSYRPAHLAPLLDHDRAVFEHWTHDAAVIPMAFYPYWQMRFARDAERLQRRWSKDRREGFTQKFDEVLTRIRDGGPCSSSDVGEGETRKSGGWWDWHPSKTALEYLWRSGSLAVTRREAFRKIYDLTERVIPTEHTHLPPEDQAADWLNNAALDRLGFATPGELAAFWDTLRPAEVKTWAEGERAAGRLIEVEITGADGSQRTALARPNVVSEAEDAPTAPKRMRVLSPFDPALRDRKRAERLFGFHYRIEIFVPAAKRQYGYYVFPLMEGDRLVGRIDMSADRKTGVLHVTALWPETGVRWGDARQSRLEAELARVARFAGLDQITWASDWKR